MICSKCRFDNPEQTRFCGRCGAPLRPSSPGFDSRTRTIRGVIQNLGPGQLFAGRYRVIEELGRGGMGTVYKVLDQEIEEHVALKLLNPEIAVDDELIGRFRNELKLARRITHKNVCRMYDLSTDGEQLFITMEYVSGESLKTTIERDGTLPIAKAVALALQIGSGLVEAHKKGIIHRDLKSQNIMIDGEGNAHIMDFGIARSTGDPGITGKNVIVGTPHYMSPEQAEGGDVDVRSDIYSLGVILYEMLTGSLPFDGKTPVEVIVKHKTEEVTDPRTIVPAVPESLSLMVLKCLAKRPEDRYRDMDRFLTDIEATGLSRTVFPGSEQRHGPGKGRSDRRRGKRWIAAAVGLPILFFLLWMAFGERKIRQADIPAENARLPAWTHAVAVLPFQNLSADPEQDYFCDGMTEQLISNIAHIKTLRVPARTTVMAYKDVTKDVRQIARELGVSHIVEGSVRRSGNRIRVTADLIDVKADSHLWSKSFDRTMDDVFAIQDEVSQAVAEALRLKLPSETISRIRTPQPSDVEAYDAYLEARHIIHSRFMKSHEDKDFRDALQFALQAVKIDPGYALGYLGLAYLYEVKMTILPDAGDRETQRLYLEKAYAIDPELALVNSGLGFSYLQDGDFDKAFQFIRRGLEINPNQYDVCHLTGYFFQRIGLEPLAIDFYTRAVAIDQKAFFSYGNRGFIHLLLGELPQAQDDLRKCLEIQPRIPVYEKALALVHILNGEFEPADQLLKETGVDQSDSRFNNWYRAVWYAAKGDKDSALKVQKNAAVLALLGMDDEAVEMMFKERDEFYWLYSYPALRGCPIYKNLKQNRRFKSFVEEQKAKYSDLVNRYSLRDLD